MVDYFVKEIIYADKQVKENDYEVQHESSFNALDKKNHWIGYKNGMIWAKEAIKFNAPSFNKKLEERYNRIDAKIDEHKRNKDKNKEMQSSGELHALSNIMIKRGIF